MDIDETVKIMLKGAAEYTAVNEIKEKLKSAEKEGRPLRIKLGLDPSAPDIHLGHAVVLRKIRQLQDLGHEAIIIIGDFTGMIGDPSGKSKTRKQLTREQVEENAETYKEQIFKVLDKEKTTVKYNSEWLGAMSFRDVIELCAKCTVARILERDDFNNRISNNIPISMHELLYPLMQGYDSVALKSDIEIGGTDQTFNLLVGRELQRDYNQNPQEVLTFPLLVGTDGIEKMSKSLNNYIGIDESSETMYEKIMKIPDNVLIDYFRLTTDIPLNVAEKLIKEDIINAHREYAKEIIKMYHGEQFIVPAMERYSKIAQGGIPQDISEINFEVKFLNICKLLNEVQFANSNSEARRMIEGKGIKIDGNLVLNSNDEIELKDGMVIQFGKNRFVKVRLI